MGIYEEYLREQSSGTTAVSGVEPESFLKRAGRALLPRAFGLEEAVLGKAPESKTKPSTTGPVYGQYLSERGLEQPPPGAMGVDIEIPQGVKLADYVTRELADVESRIENLKKQEAKIPLEGPVFAERHRLLQSLFEGLAGGPSKAQQKVDIGQTVRNYEIAAEGLKQIAEGVQKPEVFSLKFLADVQKGIIAAIKESKGAMIPLYESAEQFRESMGTLDALEKQKRGEKLSDLEQSLVEKFKVSRLPIPRSRGEAVGRSIASIPTYALEFMITSAIFTGVKEAVLKKAVEKAPGLITKGAVKIPLLGIQKTIPGLATEIVGSTIGAAAQGAVNLPAIGARTAEYLLPNHELLLGEKGDTYIRELDRRGEDFVIAFSKAFGSQTIEYLTERAGAIVDEPISLLQRAVLGRYVAKFGTDFLRKIPSLAWSGVKGEVFEEELSALGQAVLEGQPFKAPWLTPEGSERLWVETLSIGAFGGLGRIPDAVVRSISAVKRGEEIPETPAERFRREQAEEPEEVPPGEEIALPEAEVPAPVELSVVQLIRERITETTPQPIREIVDRLDSIERSLRGITTAEVTELATPALTVQEVTSQLTETQRQLDEAKEKFADRENQDLIQDIQRSLRTLTTIRPEEPRVGIPLAERAPAEKVKPEVPERPPKVEEVKAIKVSEKEPIKVVQAIVPRRPVIPALGAIRVSGGFLRATDLEIGVRLRTEIPEGVYRLVGKELAPEKKIPPEEMPELPPVAGETVFTFADAEDIADTLKKMSAFVGEREEISGVLFDIKENKVILVATDSFRLFRQEFPGKVGKVGKFQVRSAKKLSAVLVALGDKVEIKVEEKDFVHFVGDNGAVSVRKVDAKFPDYEKIYPAYTTQYEMDREELKDALTAIKPYADRMGVIQIFKKPEGLLLHAESEAEGLEKEILVKAGESTVEGKKEAIPGMLVMSIKKEEGGEIFAKFNVAYLIDAVKVLGGDRVFFSISKDVSGEPAHLSNENEFRGERSIVEAKPEIEEREAIVIPPELEPLAQEARDFESARLWEQALSATSETHQKEVSELLIKYGFIEAPPEGFISKVTLPDVEAFYNQAVRGVKKEKEEPPTPSGEAFARIERGGLVPPEFEPERGRVPERELGPLEFPEMVALAKDLMGDKLGIKKFKVALGRFYGTEGAGPRGIKLTPELFQPGRERELAFVLAHEIGHLTDFLPDNTLKRGNLLGHLLSLHKFMKAKYGDLDVTNKTLKRELIAASEFWNPIPEGVSERSGYVRYRRQARELYADAISLLLNSPGSLQMIAPGFYDNFFEFLDQKPEVRDAYFALQELITNREALNEDRLNRMYEGYKEARAKREALEEKGEEKLEMRKKGWLEEATQQHVTRFAPILKKRGATWDLGIEISPQENLRLTLEDTQMARNDVFLFYEKVDREIVQPLRSIGVAEEQLGVLLELERNIGGRFGAEGEVLANPRGYQKAVSEELREFLKGKMTPEQAGVVDQAIKRFHQEVFKYVEEGKEVGIYGEEIFRDRIEPFRDVYATFQVVEHIDKNYIAPSVKVMRGTLKEIENPFVSTLMKTASLIRMITQQKAKNLFVEEWEKNFPGEIFDSEPIRDSQGKPTGRFKEREGFDRIEMYENGKWVGKDVDPYLAKAFERYDPTSMHTLIRAARGFNRIFKQLVTTYNISWGFYSNIIRDTKRTQKNINAILSSIDQKLSIREFVMTWLRSIPTAARLAKGELNDLSRSMIENKAYATTFIQYNPYADEDSDFRALLTRFGIAKDEENPAKKIAERSWFGRLGMKILEGIKFAGGTFEATTKVAGYQILSRRIENARKVGFLTRTYVGTPNFLAGGIMKETDNNVFVFSNILLQGMRSDWELANKPTTRGGYWMQTFVLDVMPKLAMVAVAAGLFGDPLKELLDKATEYDKTNYIVIPLGQTRDGKAVYWRIPHDEMGRFYAALAWKLGQAISGELKRPDQVMTVGVGMLPSLSPVFDIAGAWIQWAQGRNPYDSFYGRTVADETTWNAGGIPRFKKMLQWTANNSGLTQFATYDPVRQTTTEYRLSQIPVVNRAIKITDYGETERLRNITQDIERRRSRELLHEREVIRDYLIQSRDMELDQKRDLQQKLGAEVYGERDTPEKRDRFDRLLKKMRTAELRGASDPKIDALIDANTNEEKRALLQDYKERMSVADFKELRELVTRERIVNWTLFQQLSEPK